MKQTLKTILIVAVLISTMVAGVDVRVVFSQSPADKSRLENELKAVEKLIEEYENELAETKAEKDSLARKIKQLKNEQVKIQLQMRSTTLRVNRLDAEITVNEESIEQSTDKIARLKKQTAELVNHLYVSGDPGVLELFLNSENFADALSSVAQSENLLERITESSQELKIVKAELEQKQILLDQQHDEANNLLALQSLQEGEFRAKVAEQGEILGITQGIESQYQALLNESRKKAAQIRARLYELAGGGSGQVTFGQAVEIAKSVSDQTGVRAAFLLAILTQESNLGKNVGTCNRAGDPPEKSYKKIMHPTRDVPKFEPIVAELGFDPETTPVSCPMMRNGKRVGWGGAMGPAQFIPSTWVGYKDKVAAITGKSANPWDIHDAFLAAGLLLKSRGATRNGRQGEWSAAMQYFSGGTNLAYRFYGDNVLKLADKYQAEIDALSGQ